MGQIVDPMTNMTANTSQLSHGTRGSSRILVLDRFAKFLMGFSIDRSREDG